MVTTYVTICFELATIALALIVVGAGVRGGRR